MWTTEYYGVEETWDPGTLGRFTKTLGESHGANMEKFFGLRVSKNKDITAWGTTTLGTDTDMDGLAEYNPSNKDNEDLKQVKIGLATDLRGIPLMYRVYSGALSDVDTLERMTDDINRFGGSDAIYVMDRGFCSGSNLKHMSDRKYRFVLPAPITGKAVKRLLTLFNSSKEVLDIT